MAVNWPAATRKEIDEAMAEYDPPSAMCAPLARVVYSIAKPLDEATVGLSVRVKPGVPAGEYIKYLPLRPLRKYPYLKSWRSHTLVLTHAHHVDALTGSAGCQADYLAHYFQYDDALELVEVDVNTVDVGLQDLE